MTNESDPVDPRDVEQLRAFGDDLADGHARPPATDIEDTLLRTHHALAADRLAASAMPDSLKQTMWEDLMHAHAEPVTLASTFANPSSGRIALRADTRSAPTRNGSVLSRSRNTGLTRAVMRWQPAVSLAIVVAFLVGLIGIGYQHGIWTEGGSPAPSGNASQVMYDPGDASTFPEVPAQCASNGPVESDAFHTDMSIGNFPQPGYTPVQAVTPDVGERIQQTYLRFARCQYESMESYPYPEATPSTYSDTLSPLALSYFSGRARLALLYPQLDATQQAKIDAQQCAGIEEILTGFPLPLNQPLDYALISSTVDNFPNVTSLAFAPSDVYLLPDGRFGAIIGTLSTAALVDPSSATQDDQLTFVAFVEQDGCYLMMRSSSSSREVWNDSPTTFSPRRAGRHT